MLGAHFPIVAAVLGLLLGSFYSVCATRYGGEESIVFSRSRCPRCGHRLAWWENIPLLGYALLLGRCRSCRRPISLRYPLLEVLSALWAWALAVRFGPGPGFWMLLALGGLLLVASFIDLERRILPDVLILPGAALALACSVAVLGRSWPQALLGGLAGAGSLWCVQATYRLLRGRDGLGDGDVKLMLLLGFLVGWRALPMLFVAASLSGLAAGVFYMAGVRGGARLQVSMPFGPFLSFAGSLLVLWPSMASFGR